MTHTCDFWVTPSGLLTCLTPNHPNPKEKTVDATYEKDTPLPVVERATVERFGIHDDAGGEVRKLIAEAREYADPSIYTGYKPFDQDEKIPNNKSWGKSLPEIKAWEKAHGHDIRLKCYPEFNCAAIEAYDFHLIGALADALESALPRVVTTVEELDALPEGTLVMRSWLASDPDVYRKTGEGWAELTDRNDFGYWSASFVWTSIGVVTVLFSPVAS